MLAAVFQLSDAIEPNLNTRIKMNQSSWVYAVAMTADGRTLFARRDVKITLGGCGV
jgi:sulfur-oxidizing protein SoxY